MMSGCVGALRTGAWLGGVVSLWLTWQAQGQAPQAAMPDTGVGWRGDGSGRYPDASPPVHWGRTAKSLRQLRAQAARPKDGQTGQPIADGVVREWLVLGPVPWDEDSQPWKKDLLPNESDLAPDENQKTGDLTWNRVAAETACLDLRNLFAVEKIVSAVAYAHAYVYCEADQAYRVYWPVSSGSKLRILLNGSELDPAAGWRGAVRLAKGWNRLLLRISCGKGADTNNREASWYLRLLFYGADGCQYESRNIRWTTPLPGWSIASPIVVGDKIFALSEERTLCCVAKKDGKILWTRTTTVHDAATPEERKAHPEVFQEIAPLAARLQEIDAAPGTASKHLKEKRKLEKSIHRLMSKVDPEKYDANLTPDEPGSSIATPTSDGRYVYARFQPNVIACFDLEGNRKWTCVCPVLQRVEHGYTSSPCLADGKLLVHADQLVALDTAGGKPVWQMPRESVVWEKSPPGVNKEYTRDWGYLYRASLVPATLGGQGLVVTPVSVVRAVDGRELGSMREPHVEFIPTPVVDGRRIYRLACRRTGKHGYTHLDVFELPADPVESYEVRRIHRVLIDAARFPRFFEGSYLASPLVHEGLVYCVNCDGVLSVVDVEKEEVVYQKALDFDWILGYSIGPARGGCGASPTQAGKYIYLFGNQGTCLVIRPGRRYDQVAKNRIEHIGDLEGSPCRGRLEQTMTCPVFEGSRLYYRGMDYLHCIGDAAEGVKAQR